MTQSMSRAAEGFSLAMKPVASSASWVLAFTLVFNLIDTMWTMCVVLMGWAVEVNPFMARLLDQSPMLFTCVKLLLVSLGVYVLWQASQHRLARLGAYAVCSAYGCLVAYHVASLGYLLA